MAILVDVKNIDPFWLNRGHPPEQGGSGGLGKRPGWPEKAAWMAWQAAWTV